jgi:secondary thiamine-phosphate synthase enzyme
MYQLSIRTRVKVEFQDITQRIQDTVDSSGIDSGVCHIFVPHTTAAIIVNEHADPNVTDDIASRLETMVPQHFNYRHTEGNADAHIKASLLGNSLTLIIDSGRITLGTWQGIFLCEFDGPRSRTVVIKIMSDKP